MENNTNANMTLIEKNLLSALAEFMRNAVSYETSSVCDEHIREIVGMAMNDRQSLGYVNADDVQTIVSDAIDNKLDDRIGSLIERQIDYKMDDYDFDDIIGDYMYNADYVREDDVSEMVNDAIADKVTEYISDYDYDEIINNFLDNYCFDDAIENYLDYHEYVSSESLDNVVSEAVSDAIDVRLDDFADSYKFSDSVTEIVNDFIRDRDNEIIKKACKLQMDNIVLALEKALLEIKQIGGDEID